MNTDTPGKAILIVEDNADIRDTFRTLFELEGFDVRLAANGEDALHRLDDEPAAPCLILLDLAMPVMDGWQFLDVLRSREDGGDIPVTVLSANVAILIRWRPSTVPTSPITPGWSVLHITSIVPSSGASTAMPSISTSLGGVCSNTAPSTLRPPPLVSSFTEIRFV